MSSKQKGFRDYFSIWNKIVWWFLSLEERKKYTTEVIFKKMPVDVRNAYGAALYLYEIQNIIDTYVKTETEPYVEDVWTTEK